ncbi:hypothetical protein Dimus_037500 [Dionaea muscipula]
MASVNNLLLLLFPFPCLSFNKPSVLASIKTHCFSKRKLQNFSLQFRCFLFPPFPLHVSLQTLPTPTIVVQSNSCPPSLYSILASITEMGKLRFVVLFVFFWASISCPQSVCENVSVSVTVSVEVCGFKSFSGLPYHARKVFVKMSLYP